MRSLGDPVEQEVERGTAGASARREAETRRQRRDEGVRNRHKRLGGLLLALSDEPQSTTAWALGAAGEEVSSRGLDALRSTGIAVLHDRRVPGTTANIDHLVISPAGVFVIDTKHYRGRVEKRDVGGWFRSDERLFVGGRDRSKLLAGMARQVAVVRTVVARERLSFEVPVVPALWFNSAENWSLLTFRPLRFGDVYVVWGKALGALIRGDARIPHEAVPDLEKRLALALPVR